MTNSRTSRGGVLLDSLHERLRAWTAPLQAVASLVPPQADVVDLGCGQGLMTSLIAKSARSVVGVDFDERKCILARARLSQAPHVRIVRGDIVEWLKATPAQSLDAVVLSDTLSSMPPPIQDQILGEACRVLRAHGTLILKIVDTEPSWKAALARGLAFLVYRVARASLSQLHQRVYYRKRTEYAGTMSEGGLSVDVILLHRLRHSPIPHVAIVGRKS